MTTQPAVRAASPALDALAAAVDHWIHQRDATKLVRWLGRELDADGVPVRLDLLEWWDCVAALMRAARSRPGWPQPVEERVLGLLRAALRFSRPAGSIATDLDGGTRDADHRALFAELFDRHSRAAEGRVLGWWLGRQSRKVVPPPLPAWSCQRRVLAVLRGGWKKDDDLLVVDHRGTTAQTRLELVGAGCSWLGPEWRQPGLDALTTAARPGTWVTSSAADCLEWSYRSGALRLRQLAVLFRGRKTALLAVQAEAGTLAGTLCHTEFCLPPGITAERLENCRGMLLRSARGRVKAQALPLALPAAPYDTDRGHLRAADDGTRLSLAAMAQGRKLWMPLLLTWDPRRCRRPPNWRVLTVAQQSRVCAPDTAFAVRVSWGREDTLVIYRSLAHPPRDRSWVTRPVRGGWLAGSRPTGSSSRS